MKKDLLQKITNAGDIKKIAVYYPPSVSTAHAGGKSTYSDNIKNYKKAVENLNLKIAQNFKSGESWFITITLKDPYYKIENLNKVRKLKNRLIRFLKKYYQINGNGICFRTVGVIERGKRGQKRLHIHMIIPKIVLSPLKRALNSKFPKEISYIYQKKLFQRGNDEFTPLAKYMLKDRYRNDDYKSVRFFHNLERPDVDVKSIFSYENPLNGKIEEIDGFSINKSKTKINYNSSEPTGVIRYDKDKN